MNVHQEIPPCIIDAHHFPKDLVFSRTYRSVSRLLTRPDNYDSTARKYGGTH